LPVADQAVVLTVVAVEQADFLLLLVNHLQQLDIPAPLVLVVLLKQQASSEATTVAIHNLAHLPLLRVVAVAVTMLAVELVQLVILVVPVAVAHAHTQVEQQHQVKVIVVEISHPATQGPAAVVQAHKVEMVQEQPQQVA
jgi:hypothetical protein